MDNNKVFIDTDDLRNQARKVQGVIGALSEVSVTMTRISADPSPAALEVEPAVRQALADIDKLGSQLTEDHDALLGEVYALEVDEGVDPGLPWTPPGPPPPPVMKGVVGSILAPKGVLKLLVRPSPPPPWNLPWVDVDGKLLAAGKTLEVGAEKIELPKHEPPKINTGSGSGTGGGGTGPGGGGPGGTGPGVGGGGAGAGAAGAGTNQGGGGAGGGGGGAAAPAAGGGAGGAGPAAGSGAQGAGGTAAGGQASGGQSKEGGTVSGQGEGKGSGDGDTKISLFGDGDFDPIGGIKKILTEPGAAAEELVDSVVEAIKDPEKILDWMEKTGAALLDPETLVDVVKYLGDPKNIITAAAIVGGYLLGNPALLLPLADLANQAIDGKPVSLDDLANAGIATGAGLLGGGGDAAQVFADGVKEQALEKAGDLLVEAGVPEELVEGAKEAIKGGDTAALEDAAIDLAVDQAGELAKDNLGEFGKDLDAAIDEVKAIADDPSGKAAEYAMKLADEIGVPGEVVHSAQLAEAISSGDIDGIASAGAELAKDAGADPVVADSVRDLVQGLAHDDMAKAGQAAGTLVEHVFDLPPEASQAVADVFTAIEGGDTPSFEAAVDRLADVSGLPPDVVNDLASFAQDFQQDAQASAFNHLEDVLEHFGIPESLADLLCDKLQELIT